MFFESMENDNEEWLLFRNAKSVFLSTAVANCVSLCVSWWQFCKLNSIKESSGLKSLGPCLPLRQWQSSGGSCSFTKAELPSGFTKFGFSSSKWLTTCRWEVNLKSRHHKAAQTLHLFYSLKTLTKVINCYFRAKCFVVPHKGLTEKALGGPQQRTVELIWIVNTLTLCDWVPCKHTSTFVGCQQNDVGACVCDCGVMRSVHMYRHSGKG